MSLIKVKIVPVGTHGQNDADADDIIKKKKKKAFHRGKARKKSEVVKYEKSGIGRISLAYFCL